MEGGEGIKELRTRLGLSSRDVEAGSRRLAMEKGNPEFGISHSWLTQLENQSGALPNFYKLYSLSVLYRESYANLLMLYGVDLAQIGRDQISHSLGGTSPLSIKTEEAAGSLVLPLRTAPRISLEATTLVSRLVQTWGEVPVALFQYIDAKRFVYGVIGTRDKFMDPLIPPGSFVQIDPLDSKIRSRAWQSEYERPIYFVETRNRYICGWCQVEDHHLVLIPHPLSKATMQKYRFPEDVEVVGQVV